MFLLCSKLFGRNTKCQNITDSFLFSLGEWRTEQNEIPIGKCVILILLFLFYRMGWILYLFGRFRAHTKMMSTLYHVSRPTVNFGKFSLWKFCSILFDPHVSSLYWFQSNVCWSTSLYALFERVWVNERKKGEIICVYANVCVCVCIWNDWKSFSTANGTIYFDNPNTVGSQTCKKRRACSLPIWTSVTFTFAQHTGTTQFGINPAHIDTHAHMYTFIHTYMCKLITDADAVLM